MTAAPAGQALLLHAFQEAEQLTDKQTDRKARRRLVEDLTSELQNASEPERFVETAMRFKTWVL